MGLKQRKYPVFVLLQKVNTCANASTCVYCLLRTRRMITGNTVVNNSSILPSRRSSYSVVIARVFVTLLYRLLNIRRPDYVRKSSSPSARRIVRKIMQRRHGSANAVLSCDRNCSYSRYSCEITRSRIRLPRHEIRGRAASSSREPDSFLLVRAFISCRLLCNIKGQKNDRMTHSKRRHRVGNALVFSCASRDSVREISTSR